MRARNGSGRNGFRSACSPCLLPNHPRGRRRLGLDLTKRISLGLEWPDGSPIDLQGRRPIVLWVPADSQHSELADAPAAFGFPPEAVVLNTTVGNLYGGTELEQEDQLKDLENRIIRQNPAMVLIDTVTNTSDAKSQDTSDAKRSTSRFRRSPSVPERRSSA